MLFNIEVCKYKCSIVCFLCNFLLGLGIHGLNRIWKYLTFSYAPAHFSNSGIKPLNTYPALW